MKYRLTYEKCDVDHMHKAFHTDVDGIKTFWKNWNRQYGENMKYLHDYNIETLVLLDSAFLAYRLT